MACDVPSMGVADLFCGRTCPFFVLLLPTGIFCAEQELKSRQPATASYYY